MKKALLALALILVGLAVLLPLASSNLYALDAVTANLGLQQQISMWQGIMPGYSIPSVGNNYTSALISGIGGVLMVVVAGLVVGKVLVVKRP